MIAAFITLSKFFREKRARNRKKPICKLPGVPKSSRKMQHSQLFAFQLPMAMATGNPRSAGLQTGMVEMDFRGAALADWGF